FLWLHNQIHVTIHIYGKCGLTYTPCLTTRLQVRYAFHGASMSQDQGLSLDLKSRFSALNPWPVRFTLSAHQAAQSLRDAADKAALEVLKKQLEGFPPPERQFQM